MTHEEIIAMAREAGFEVHERKQQVRVGVDALLGIDSTDKLDRFAALVAAKERERLFGAGRQFDGQMRLQLTRWEDGECFSAAAHFSEEQTHCGPDDLLQLAVDSLDDSLDASIAAAIRARGTKEGA